MPAVLLLTKYWRDDLIGIYTGMAIGYIMLAILYSIIVFRRLVKSFCCSCYCYNICTLFICMFLFNL